MKKEVLITLAIIVALLALWLLYVVLYPPRVDESTPENLVPADTMEVEAPGIQADDGAVVEPVVRIVPSGSSELSVSK